MKLYWPTSSLNFNDILATESISPPIFYELRSFGTKRHFTTELNWDPNYLVLFKDKPYFNLIRKSTSEMKEYGLLIEIDFDKHDEGLTKITDDIYIISKTIYLNVAKCKIYFFSEEQYKYLITRTHIIHEAKILSNYKENFSIFNEEDIYDFNRYEMVDKYLFPNVSDISLRQELEKDKRYNHIKGFFYGYISQGFLKKYNESLYNEKIYLKVVKNVEEAIKNYSLVNKNKQTEYVINSFAQNLSYIISEYELIKANNREYENIINNFGLDNQNSIILTNNNLINNIDMQVFIIIINSIIDMPKSKVGTIEQEEIFKLLNRVEKKMENIYKDVASYKYDFSLIKKRILNRDYDIDVLYINSIVLKNFMVFLLKYNNVEELISYLNKKGIKNNHICIAFYGAFIGFSSLSKLITNDIFSIISTQVLRELEDKLYMFSEKINYNLNHKKAIAKIVEEGKYNNETEITIINCINIIKSQSNITKLLKNDSEKINDKFEIKLEKDGKNMEIILIDLISGEIYNLYLKHKTQVENEELNLFKGQLKKINSKFNITGNYPVFTYSSTIDNAATGLTNTQGKKLINYLQNIIQYYQLK